MKKKWCCSFGLLLLLLSGGCLPCGTPPEGKIVENPLEVQPVSPGKARELAVTSLGAWSLAQAPGAAVRIAVQSDAEISFAAEVIREAGALSGIYAAPSGPYLLTVQFSADACFLQITNSAGKTVWQEKYPLRKEAGK